MKRKRHDSGLSRTRNVSQRYTCICVRKSGIEIKKCRNVTKKKLNWKEHNEPVLNAGRINGTDLKINQTDDYQSYHFLHELLLQKIGQDNDGTMESIKCSRLSIIICFYVIFLFCHCFLQIFPTFNLPWIRLRGTVSGWQLFGLYRWCTPDQVQAYSVCHHQT